MAILQIHGNILLKKCENPKNNSVFVVLPFEILTKYSLTKLLIAKDSHIFFNKNNSVFPFEVDI